MHYEKSIEVPIIRRKSISSSSPPIDPDKPAGVTLPKEEGETFHSQVPVVENKPVHNRDPRRDPS